MEEPNGKALSVWSSTFLDLIHATQPKSRRFPTKKDQIARGQGKIFLRPNALGLRSNVELTASKVHVSCRQHEQSLNAVACTFVRILNAAFAETVQNGVLSRWTA